MILLDTGVLLEVRKRRPAPRVMAWLDAQDPTNLYLTAITVGELALAVADFDPGPRRDRLDAAITAILDADFAGRILPYDRAAAALYGTRIAATHRRDVSVGQADGQIAAIALAHGTPVATRNRRPFEALDVEVIDPWQFEK